MRRALVGIAGLAPLTIDFAYKTIVRPRPFWIQYYDPEAIHFYQALRILRGVQPENFDNPGTPVQLVGSLIAAITGPTPLAYEAFLRVAHATAFALAAAALLLAAFTILRDAPPLLAIAACWSYFIAPQALERDDIYCPEAFFLPFGLLAAVALWEWLQTRRDAWLLPFGVAIGICLATKLVFAAWAVAAVVVAVTITRSIRAVALTGGAAVAGFVVSTLPIVTRYRELAMRALHLSGGFSEQTWGELVPTGKGWIVWLAVIAAIVVVALRRRQLSIGMLVFGATAFALTFVVVFRSPSFRYLLPAGIAATVALMSAAALVRLPRAAELAVLLIAAVLVGKAIRDDLHAHRARIAAGVVTRAAIDSAVPKDAVVLYSWREPEPAFALRQMTTDPRDLDAISSRFPRAGHYNIWVRRVFLPRGARTWDYLVIAPEDLKAFPEPAGPAVSRAGNYVIIRSKVP